MVSYPTVIIYGLVLLCLIWPFSASQEGESFNDQDVKIEHLHQIEKCERRTAHGDVVEMHYKGTLTDGKEFDSSLGKDPMSFTLGKGEVIKGWDEGLTDMCVGEKRRLTIPPSKAYGPEGAGDDIPPDSTLIFEVELVKISDSVGGSKEDGSDFFDQLDTNKDNTVTKEELSKYIMDQSGGGGPTDEIAENAGGHDEMIAEIFSQEDKNKDGIITRDEFLSDKHDEL